MMAQKNNMAQMHLKKTGLKKIIYASVVAFVFALLLLPLIRQKPAEAIVYNKMLLGTLIEITLYDDNADTDKAAEAAFKEIERLEKVFSSYIPDSDVSRVSLNAGKEPVKVSAEVIEALKTAIRVSELSKGAFDPTIGSLGRLWGYSGEKGELPSDKDISRALTLVDYKKIELDEPAQTVRLAKEGMALNLGGVAKGYIVKKALDTLKNNGVKKAIIRAGGDMAVYGAGSDGPFKIGIQHPRIEDKLLGEAYVYDEAVSTSGDYERFFMIGDKRYHHILDPKTGWPAKGTQAVTLIARDHTLADALSTAVFVLGPEKGMALIESLDSVEGVIVDEAGGVKASSGFKGKLLK